MLSLFRTKREKYKSESSATYDQFVTLAADGKDFDLDALVRLLIVTGGTMADFDEAVELIERRRAAHAMLAEAEKLGSLLEPATKKAAGLRAKEEEVRRQCEQAILESESIASAASLDACDRQSRVASLRSEGKAALLATCDPSFQQEIDRHEARMGFMRQEQGQIGRDAYSDPATVAAAHGAINIEMTKLQARTEELRVQQLA